MFGEVFDWREIQFYLAVCGSSWIMIYVNAIEYVEL